MSIAKRTGRYIIGGISLAVVSLAWCAGAIASIGGSDRPLKPQKPPQKPNIGQVVSRVAAGDMTIEEATQHAAEAGYKLEVK